MKSLFSLLFIFIVSSGFSQKPTLVKDINPTPNNNGSSNPSVFIEFNGKTYFAAYDGNEPGLWVTDGTNSGTIKVKGFALTPTAFWNGINQINIVGGKMIFIAYDSTKGRELWVSDGTTSGTQLLKDINPGKISSIDEMFQVVLNGKYFFQADDGTNGSELWISDGTSAGTSLLKDINLTGSSRPIFLESSNGKLFFSAETTTSGREMYITDGTTPGTSMLKEINPGAASSVNDDPKMRFVYNGKMYFTADDGINGNELWASDGTTTGTNMIKDINNAPGQGSNIRREQIEFNGKMYFTADDGTNGIELWITDGTSAGTVMLKDINTDSKKGSSPSSFCKFKNRLYFGANGPDLQYELWVTDGTTGGTQWFKEFNSPSSSYVDNLLVYNGLLYLTANASSNPAIIDLQLFSSDGTIANTKIVAPDISPTSSPLSYNYANGIKVCNGTLFFGANYTGTGTELYSLKTAPSKIEEKESTLSFQFYPNPTNDLLKIKSDESIEEVKLVDVAGKEIFNNMNIQAKEININTSDFKNGMYYLQVKWVTGNTTETRKLFVQHD